MAALRPLIRYLSAYLSRTPRSCPSVVGLLDAVGEMIRRLEIDHGKGMMLDRKMTSITDLLGCFFPSVDRIVKSVRATLVGRILRL